MTVHGEADSGDAPRPWTHACNCILFTLKIMFSPADCSDPPATSSHARKCLTVGTHLVEAYVALSFWSRMCTSILMDVEACTCRSRGVHVACTRTYRGQCARKKIRSRTYIRAGSRTPTRAYVGQGSCTWLGRNGETASSSCSWGANRMRRVHGEATECVVFIGRQQNAWEPTGLDGTGDGNEAWRTAEWMKQTSYDRNGVLLIGRGLAYRRTKEMDLLQSKRGSC